MAGQEEVEVGVVEVGTVVVVVVVEEVVEEVSNHGCCSLQKKSTSNHKHIFTTHSNPFMFEQQNKGVVVEEVVEEVVDSNNNKIIHEVQVHQPNIITTLQTSTMAMATITTMHTIDLKAPYHHPVEEGITPLFEIRNKLIIVRRMVKRVPRHTPYQKSIGYN